MYAYTRVCTRMYGYVYVRLRMGQESVRVDAGVASPGGLWHLRGALT